MQDARERQTRESWLGTMQAGGVHSRDEEAEEDEEDVFVRRGAIGWDPWHSLRAEIVWFGSRHLEPESDELAINPVRVLGGWRRQRIRSNVRGRVVSDLVCCAW